MAVEGTGESRNGDDSPAAIVVPEVRDYAKINAELKALLDAGHRRVRLIGVDGQRLLASGLTGDWEAEVEVEGNAGPELAAGLDAPHLTVICQGSAGDGAARGLAAGRVEIHGAVGAAVGYMQTGGTIDVRGTAGPRAGLRQKGGSLTLRAGAGRLPGERQSGGTLRIQGPVGPYVGYGRSGGILVHIEGGHR